MQKKVLKLTILTILFLIMVIIIFMLSKDNVTVIDDKIYKFLSKMINPRRTTFFKAITIFGGPYILIGISFLLVFIKRKYALYSVINLILVFILNIVLKTSFGRIRPEGINLIVENGYSFPSAHAMISIAFYGFLIFLINKQKIKPALKIISTALLSVLIFLIGLSRVYLGVHYATDVICGFIIGLICLEIYITIINKKKSIK